MDRPRSPNFLDGNRLSSRARAGCQAGGGRVGRGVRRVAVFLRGFAGGGRRVALRVEARARATSWFQFAALLLRTTSRSGIAGFLLAAGGLPPAAVAIDAARWPLDLPPVLTSSFGEYRANHIHAGMDFGTGGRTGALCRAVGDGSVVRMRMSPYGYGKALYIQLDGGPLLVYAHLSRFAEPMAARARAEQKRLGRYTFDINLPAGEMRVLRGSVIAWSGDTGV